ncbi:hypothetical protein BEWA_046590 [Theileria equi strain WA]|uniref:Uncharacterized protein n=1 Tax=Theileria equi strain WA TaxID=1537102 RepID=L1LAB1_THEEQ|nr:hypothetical protein BEWA_046590 [Theileria equi strain WA]EKX72195.1 hypothetical protein BEWA_046590 [Theileria equi strain WA]|eukprot:XP_004831647.1 hypothetical protein BEWA_046590 [Theileria equi strain WA]
MSEEVQHVTQVSLDLHLGQCTVIHRDIRTGKIINLYVESFKEVHTGRPDPKNVENVADFEGHTCHSNVCKGYSEDAYTENGEGNGFLEHTTDPAAVTESPDSDYECCGQGDHYEYVQGKLHQEQESDYLAYVPFENSEGSTDVQLDCSDEDYSDKLTVNLESEEHDEKECETSSPPASVLDDNRPKRRIAVNNVTPTFALGRYEVYEHIIPDSVESCKVNYGGLIQEIPVVLEDSEEVNVRFRDKIHTSAHSAKRVFVYFCKDTPLLIYIKAPEGKGRGRWLKNRQDGGAWEVVEYPPANEYAYRDIVDVLDTLESDCGPPCVIVDISQKEGAYVDPDSPSKHQITVVKNVGPQSEVPDNYIMYDHTIEGRSYFTMATAKCAGETIDIIRNIDKVTRVSVYYWEHDNHYNMPLVMRVSRHAGDEWHENGGSPKNTKWNALPDFSA